MMGQRAYGQSLGHFLAAGRAHAGPREPLRARVRAVVSALEPAETAASLAAASDAALLRHLELALRPVDPSSIWLALAVLGGRLPHQSEVVAAARQARVDGPLTALAAALRRGPRPLRGSWQWPDQAGVEIVTDQVLVDLHHTSQVSFATGIQRVARQTARRWDDAHHPVLVGWTKGFRNLRRLTAAEARRALFGPGDQDRPVPVQSILVPWRCSFVIPEPATDPPRARALGALAEYSRSATATIGYDCVPVTLAETTDSGVAGGFALNLSAIARMDRVATISDSATEEYAGWRAMLAGTGLPGPDIAPIALPVEASVPTEHHLREAERLLTVPGLPMVLVVGSHEPRKNHLAVLHAAELLWRDGVTFTLAFLGGNSWNNDRFAERLAQLQAAGRPVQSFAGLSDDLLWAAYRLARCTVFPSFNEGFGLPVAESLASGTPVITSNFGSMREIAAAGGALLVDPRDDHAIAAALRQLLTDDTTHARLAAEAEARPERTWDDYAAETWHYLVDGARPGVSPGAETTAHSD